MKRFATAGLMMLFLMSIPALGVEIQSRITDVMVYTEKASVTRTSSVTVKAGDSQVQIVGFPDDLEADSLQVEVSNPSVKIGQVSVKEVVYREATDPEYIALTRQKEAVQAKIRVLEDSTKSAQLQLKFLESMTVGDSAAANNSGARTNPANWQQALTVIHNGAESAFKNIRDYAEQIAELKKDLSLLESKRSAKRSRAKVASVVLVNLSSPASADTTIRVIYEQWGASWRPFYEVRLDSASEQLTIDQKAIIEQDTEEEWLNAKVTLSTSQPNKGIEAPVVRSEFIDLRDAYAADQYAEVYASSAGGGGLEEIVVTGARKSTWTGNFALNFPIPGRINVSNDADEAQRFELNKYQFDSQLITQIVPTQEAKAYLVARFTSGLPMPLYGSDMQVFVDGVLMGNARMPDILPGAEISLPMGQDRRIDVEVIDLGGQGGDAGVIKKQRVEARDYLFEIVNRRANVAKIEVREAYPISKHRSAKIKIGDTATSPTVRDENDKAGVMLWTKDLQPNDTWKINYNYTLTYPADKAVNRSTGN